MNPIAREALDNFKYEIADELGLINKIYNKGWQNMTTREAGKVGGNMVKKMVQYAENNMTKNNHPEE